MDIGLPYLSKHGMYMSSLIQYVFHSPSLVLVSTPTSFAWYSRSLVTAVQPLSRPLLSHLTPLCNQKPIRRSPPPHPAPSGLATLTASPSLGGQPCTPPVRSSLVSTSHVSSPSDPPGGYPTSKLASPPPSLPSQPVSTSTDSPSFHSPCRQSLPRIFHSPSPLHSITPTSFHSSPTLRKTLGATATSGGRPCTFKIPG